MCASVWTGCANVVTKEPTYYVSPQLERSATCGATLTITTRRTLSVTPGTTLTRAFDFCTARTHTHTHTRTGHARRHTTLLPYGYHAFTPHRCKGVFFHFRWTKNRGRCWPKALVLRKCPPSSLLGEDKPNDNKPNKPVKHTHNRVEKKVWSQWRADTKQKYARCRLVRYVA